jgi:endonuclease/exonuclease/phosphatase family metal-dependent hydrolase
VVVAAAAATPAGPAEAGHGHGHGHGKQVAHPAPARINAGQISVVSHNVSGDEIGGEAALQGVYHLVDQHAPDVVAIQEVCQTQFNKFKNRYPGYTSNFYPLKQQNQPGHTCPGDHWLGNAIAARGEYTATGPFYQLSLGGEWGAACWGFWKDNLPIFACSVHLIAGGDAQNGTRYSQANTMRGWSDGWTAAGWRVIYMGDFNDTPASNAVGRINKFNGGSGQFIDADHATMSATHRSNGCAGAWAEKFDYIFFSDNMTNASSVSAAFDTTTCSGHKAIWGHGPLN